MIVTKLLHIISQKKKLSCATENKIIVFSHSNYYVSSVVLNFFPLTPLAILAVHPLPPQPRPPKNKLTTTKVKITLFAHTVHE